MKAIVAIDKLWGIGKDGDLLFHNKKDMKFFKETTIGKVVVMGRKTFESLPNGEPLKYRINLVITSGKFYKEYDNVVFGNIDEINEEIKKYDTDDIFIIGGESIYKQFIHRCDTIYVTTNTDVYEADTYMPNLAFEGFSPANKTHIDDNLSIIEWVTSGCKPFKSVLWFKDSDNNIVFLYTDIFYHWRGVYSDHIKIITNELKNKLKSILEYKNKDIKLIKLYDYYRMEINMKKDGNELRLASFGETEGQATQNLISIITDLLV